jgi:hypothetical protein
LFPFGTAEKVSVIDKIGTKVALGVFLEECLPVVGVVGTNVNHPCKPKALEVANPLEAVTWKDFQ